MTPTEELETFSFLWDGAQNWEMATYFYTEYVIKIVFANEIPTVRELIALRKAAAEFRNVPVHEMKTRVGTSGQITLGHFSSMEAHEIWPRLEKLGLNVRSTSTDTTTYRAINRSTGEYLLIEDMSLAERICQKMRSFGRRVNSIEID